MTTPAEREAEHFAPIAARLAGLLNRVVFYGVASCRTQLDGRDGVRAPTDVPGSYFAICTTPLDRLGGELTTAGWTRVARTQMDERWTTADGLSLTVEAVPTDGSGADDAAVLEYASLMTRSVVLGTGTTIRVTALSAQLPLFWRAHARSALTFSTSPWVEDIIELVHRRNNIRGEIAALPAELRAAVVRSAAEFAASDAALWTIERALPDARSTPGLAAKALVRFHEIAALVAA